MASTSAEKPKPMAINDPSVPSKFANLNGIRYHYLHGQPSGTPKATIFLIHGFPDFSYGYRYQIPYLMSQGYQVVVPDMIGYGQTEAPQDLKNYTFKRAADDMEELAQQLDVPKVILIGHDWGGAIVYRIALWKPALIQAVISVCTPYNRPNEQYMSNEDVVKIIPRFQYQIHMASGEVEEHIKSKEQIKHFLNSLFGARTKDGAPGFDVTKGALFDVINAFSLEKTSLLTEEEWDHYASEFSRNGIRGAVNWYKTRKLNWEDERPFAKEQQEKGLKIGCPTLYVGASRDVALPPAMAKGMEQNFEELRKDEVEGGHWILVQRPEVCNPILGRFLEDVVEREGGRSKI